MNIYEDTYEQPDNITSNIFNNYELDILERDTNSKRKKNISKNVKCNKTKISPTETILEVDI